MIVSERNIYGLYCIYYHVRVLVYIDFNVFIVIIGIFLQIFQIIFILIIKFYDILHDQGTC